MKSKSKIILHDHNHDGLDRRGFLECMAWAGTPGPMKVEPGKLRDYLGVTEVSYTEGRGALAVVDSTLVAG